MLCTDQYTFKIIFFKAKLDKCEFRKINSFMYSFWHMTVNQSLIKYKLINSEICKASKHLIFDTVKLGCYRAIFFHTQNLIIQKLTIR